MKTWATGVDSMGMTRQITVGDIWENLADDVFHCEILSFNGQYFESEIIHRDTGHRQKAKITDFNYFVNSWQIFSYSVTIKLESAIEFIPINLNLSDLKVAINCECGAHKVGVKDYTKGHSSWCKVYKHDA